MTCCSSGCPAKGCSTLGRSEFMRLPCPAASMTTESGMTAPSELRACQCYQALEPVRVFRQTHTLALLAQPLDRPQLRHGSGELRLGLGDLQLVAAGAHRVLGALLGRQRFRLIEIARSRS